MTSILDQYEENLAHNYNTSNTTCNGPDQGYIHNADEMPMFMKRQVDISPHDMPARVPILDATVADESLVIVFTNNIMIRYEREQNKGYSFRIQQEIDLNKMMPGVKLRGIFLDSSANHLLISFSTELLYQHKMSPKPRPMKQLKGQEVTAVAWHPKGGTPSSTRPLLAGTSAGIIYELEISQEETFFQSLELYCKQVFDIGKGAKEQITGLEYGKLENSYFVIVTTKNRLYQFVCHTSNEDRPLLQRVFNKYLNKPEGFQAMPSKLSNSWLEIGRPAKGPPSLAWLTQTGIFYAQIESKEEEDLLSKTGMVSIKAGCGLLLTDFHFLLLYPHKLLAISTLSEEQVFSEHYDESYGRLIKIMRDKRNDTIWVIAERGALFTYRIKDEDRHVWKIYMEQGKYETAKIFCKDPASMDCVLSKQAESLFNENKFESSAEIYAKTRSPFEEVALKFLKANQPQALKLFLKEKLNKLEKGEKAQQSMLIIWILEIILGQLGRAESTPEGQKEKDLLTLELHCFLSQDRVKECVKTNRNAIYGLMASHGNETELLHIASSIDDKNTVLAHRINNLRFSEALDVLKECDAGDEETWYRFLPPLVQALPKRTLEVVMYTAQLVPERLLPALVAADIDQVGEVVRYLEFSIGQLHCQEKAVHNFLISLYAQHNPDRLMKYLAMQGEEASMVNYDIEYAVRICRKFDRKRACVQLLALLGLWEMALETALQIEVALAKQVASQCPSHLARTLWLKIAQHVVEKENDIEQAMEFLKQCEEIKIEDILPFFSDFVTIDLFRDAICSSLQEYNQHIQEVKEEMEDATKSAEAIRLEIQSFRKKYCEIKGDDVCCECKLGILLRPFYWFPCGHTFHSDCLLSRLLPLLDATETATVTSLQKQLLTETNGSAAREAAKAQMDSILASQCLYCGDRTVELISTGFVPDDDYERIRKEWE